jgi:hypothetical protein
MDINVKIEPSEGVKKYSFEDILKEPGIYQQIVFAGSAGIFINAGNCIYYTDSCKNKFYSIDGRSYMKEIWDKPDIFFEKLNSKTLTVTFKFD